MLFRPSGTFVHLSSPAPYEKLIITNSGLKLDSALKFDSHLNTAVKSRMFPVETAVKKSTLFSPNATFKY